MTIVTIFLAEDKNEVGGTVFKVRVQVSHETDQTALDGAAFLRPLGNISQRRQNLQRSNSFAKECALLVDVAVISSTLITYVLMKRRVSLCARQLSVSRLRIGVTFSLILSPFREEKHCHVTHYKIQAQDGKGGGGWYFGIY